jgi:polyisoprenoid-binding protein YceI
MRRLLLALAAALLIAPAFAGEKTFAPDTAHTMIGFKAATLLFDVPGAFRSYKVEVNGDPAALENAKVKLSIDTASIDTANKQRDNHLRQPDFFDAANFPKITFASNKIWREGGKLMVAGSLDMHGVKKDMTLAFDEVNGKNGAGNDTWAYKTTLKLNRKDFNIGEGIAAKISLKDEVELNLLLVGFFNEAEVKPAHKPAPRKGMKKAA